MAILLQYLLQTSNVIVVNRPLLELGWFASNQHLLELTADSLANSIDWGLFHLNQELAQGLSIQIIGTFFV
jgi:hypothetical protein